MLKTVRELTGGDQLSYLVNGRVVPAREYDTLCLKDGDDVRWVHPAFGG
jgi:sulfur carrier protein ThiS